MSNPILAAPLSQVSEADFQQTVIQLFRATGWRVYHNVNSKGSDPGWPDLQCLKRGRLVFAELKTQRGRVTAEQEFILNELRGAGQETYLWRPSDWVEIERVALEH